MEDAPGIAGELLEKARTRLEFLYGEVARTWPGFIARPGQHQMMHAALLTFLSASSPEVEGRAGNNLALLEAGTGTGKTVAYCLAAIVASELLDKTVIVSTATVALQDPTDGGHPRMSSSKVVALRYLGKSTPYLRRFHNCAARFFKVVRQGERPTPRDRFRAVRASAVGRQADAEKNRQGRNIGRPRLVHQAWRNGLRTFLLPLMPSPQNHDSDDPCRLSWRAQMLATFCIQ